MPKDFVGVAGEKGTLPSWKAVKAAQRVLDLPVAERRVYAERLGRLRSRASSVGWGVEDEFNNIWYEADLGD